MTKEKLISRFRRNASLVQTAGRSESDLLKGTLNLFKNEEHIGGEGVLYIQASKESGYWFITMLALRGRAFAKWPMFIYTVYTVLIVCFMQRYMGDYIDDPNNASIFEGLQASLSLVGIALFFLQTFRTNSAYDRWWEGRVIWGVIGMHLISIATEVTAGNIYSRKLARRLLRWSLAFIVTTKISLRGDSDLGELTEIMSPDELKLLEALPSPSRAILSLSKMKEAWGAMLRSNTIEVCATKELERILPELSLSMGGVRRIMGTPMPFAYICHLRSFLWIWISVLPFVFMYYMKYLSIAVCLVLAYSLLGMEELSLEIEAPFGRDFNDLPTDNLTDDVANVILSAYESTVGLPSDDGDDGDGDHGLQWPFSNNLVEDIAAGSELPPGFQPKESGSGGLIPVKDAGNRVKTPKNVVQVSPLLQPEHPGANAV